MPKRRGTQDKINYYQAKLRKLEENSAKARQRRRRVVIYSDSSNSDENSDDETPNNGTITDVIASSEHLLDTTAAVPTEDAAMETSTPEVTPGTEPSASDLPPADSAEAGTSEDPVPPLDAEFLSALGEAADEKPTYGAKIHPDLAQRWLQVLRRGILKEPKEKLLKEYAIPENCKLLRAPTLNPEISAAITEAARARDKKLESLQQQLGLGITAINRAMSLLFTGEDKQSKVQAIKILSDGCRMLSDIHYMETQARIKSITPALDKSFINIIQDMERDETLFGNKLSEKIKVSKTIEKQGLQIKKGTPVQKTPSPSTSQPPTRTRFQGNWTAPSRYQQSSNRGGRGGMQKTTYSGQKPAPSAPAQNKNSPGHQAHNKPRAPPRQ